MLKKAYDERRDLIIGKSAEETVRIAADHWIETASEAIAARGKFSAALSGGSTPNALYSLLSKAPYAKRLDWSKVWLFWSDERAVPPDHPESNYFASMQHGLASLPLDPAHIFRMEAEKTPLEASAAEYEALLKKHLDAKLFDLVMLGIGEDGHTASLFPNTQALQIEDRLVAANWVPQKNCWRMTLTYPCIRQSRHVAVYAIGPSKKEIVKTVLEAPVRSPYPASCIGERGRKALWFLDESVAP